MLANTSARLNLRTSGRARSNAFASSLAALLPTQQCSRSSDRSLGVRRHAVDVSAPDNKHFDVAVEDDGRWSRSLSDWVIEARRAVGNTVNHIEIAEAELPKLLKRPLGKEIVRESIILLGRPFTDTIRPISPSSKRTRK